MLNIKEANKNHEEKLKQILKILDGLTYCDAASILHILLAKIGTLSTLNIDGLYKRLMPE